jgi:hypothetical protein
LTVPALCVRANIPIRLDRLPATIQGAQIPGVGHCPHVHSPYDVNVIVAPKRSARSAAADP